MCMSHERVAQEYSCSLDDWQTRAESKRTPSASNSRPCQTSRFLLGAGPGTEEPPWQEVVISEDQVVSWLSRPTSLQKQEN